MKELLVPVGNLECLRVAVNSGADAVYLGGKKFGARAFANNFDDEEMINAIKYCHLYGVKIYVTVNTLVYESEINDVINYVKFLHENGVDAIIVQDIGLISVIREILPNLDIHASTQVHTTNIDTIKYLESLGVTRLVYAREVSLDRINNMKTPLEKEAFIHGALCVSYSGECLASSVLFDRSGNRGECAQFCRMKYDLKENNHIVETEGKFLLSTKELNTSRFFKDILDSDIYSLKIEGRMKSAEYVGCVTKLYRDLLDKYYRHEPLNVNEEYYNDLMAIYNREYTKGFLFNASNDELMNTKTSNHIGTHLGKVLDTDKKYIYIKLSADLDQGDGIRIVNTNDGCNLNYIYNENGLLINGAKAGDTILIDNKLKCRRGDIVNKTLSVKLIDKYTKIEDKKIPIKMVVEFNKDTKVKLTITDGINIVTSGMDDAFIAEKRATTKDEIIEKLLKIGNTAFKCNDIDIVDLPDNWFISMSALNNLRRSVIDELTSLRENKKKDVIVNKYEDVNNIKEANNGISIIVRNEEQLKSCLDLVDRIYVCDEVLFNKYKDNKKVYFRTSRIGKKVNYDNLLVTELSNIDSGENRVLDYYLNITNHNTVNKLNGNINTLSIELKDEEIEKICSYYHNKTNFELIIYGTYELMLLKYCPLNLNVNKDDKCHVCLNNNKYYLVDKNGNEFRLIEEFVNHTTHLMNCTVTNKIDKINYYHSLGINNFRLELLDEDKDEVIELINEVKKNLYE